MKKIIALSLLMTGCASTEVATTPWWMQTQIVQVTSDPPGARIEAGGNYIGDTPVSMRVVRGGNDYTGAEMMIVKAIPNRPGQCVQMTTVPTNHQTPERMFFNMDLCPVANGLDVNLH